MASTDARAVEHSNAYNIFILVLTIMSLAIMVLLLLPLDSATLNLLTGYDNLICIVFLADFSYTMWRAPSKREYFFKQRGWLDLLGSIPAFPNPILKYSGLLRLARLSRLARIARLMGGQNRKEIVDDVVEHRSQYASFVTILLALLVLVTASVVVLNAEQRSDSSNIHSGWNAFWWSFVTITTVGYGDYYPVTVVGRIGAMFVMVMGIGIIGALASILASMLVSSTDDDASPESDDGRSAPSSVTESARELREELAAVKEELTQLRDIVERIDARLTGR